MVKRKSFLILLILIAAGMGAFFILSQNEEKRVKKQLSLLAKAISKEAGETVFKMDQKMKTIGSLIDDPCHLQIPAYSLSGSFTRDEIVGYAARGRLHASELLLTFHDLRVSFPGQDEADAHLTARLTGRWKTGETVHEAHEIRCHLRKVEKKWRLSRVEVVEVLKR